MFYVEPEEETVDVGSDAEPEAKRARFSDLLFAPLNPLLSMFGNSVTHVPLNFGNSPDTIYQETLSAESDSKIELDLKGEQTTTNTTAEVFVEKSNSSVTLIEIGDHHEEADTVCRENIVLAEHTSIDNATLVDETNIEPLTQTLSTSGTNGAISDFFDVCPDVEIIDDFGSHNAVTVDSRKR